MSVTVTSEIWRHSQAKGSALLILLALAEHVNDYSAREGEAWTAWPSQTTLAAKCNCSLATVKRSLAILRDLGEIEPVGTRARGVVVYELLPPPVAQTEPGQVEPGGPWEDGYPGQSGDDLAQSVEQVAQVEPSPSSTVSDKPEVTQKEEKEEEALSPSPSAQGDVLLSDTGEGKDSPSLDADEVRRTEKQLQVEERAQRITDLRLALERTENSVWRNSFEKQLAELEGEAESEAVAA